MISSWAGDTPEMVNAPAQFHCCYLVKTRRGGFYAKIYLDVLLSSQTITNQDTLQFTSKTEIKTVTLKQ